LNFELVGRGVVLNEKGMVKALKRHGEGIMKA
jgi:hypothetical protein